MAAVTVCLLLLVSLAHGQTNYTAEEGSPVRLECPGFVPNADKDGFAQFIWYKEPLKTNQNSDNQFAVYDMAANQLSTAPNVRGRVTIDTTTGALEFSRTELIDDHVYTCLFSRDTEGGKNSQHKGEVHLQITATPTSSELNINFPKDAVQEKTQYSLSCSAYYVRPPPQHFLIKFTDNTILANQSIIVPNTDSLTHNVSVQYSLTVTNAHHNKQLVCVYEPPSGNIVQSAPVTLQVLYKLSGKPRLLPEQQAAAKNSQVTLTCDVTAVDGVITWYWWQELQTKTVHNTSSKALTVQINDTELSYTCAAGNILGLTNVSQEATVDIKTTGSKLPIIIGASVGGAVVLVIIILAVIFTSKRKQRQSDKLQPDMQVTVDYNKVPSNSTEGQLYAQPMKGKKNKKSPEGNTNDLYGNVGNYNNELRDEGRTLSPEGLIYAEPAFATSRPTTSGAIAPPQPAKKPTEYVATEYGELDFKKTADMKKN